MIKTGMLIAAALIAVVSFSAPSLAQSRSPYDAELQRLNDIRQQTTDAGTNTINHPLDRPRMSYDYGPSLRDRQLQGLYRQRDDNASYVIMEEDE
jgi:hypothetical protein